MITQMASMFGGGMTDAIESMIVKLDQFKSIIDMVYI
jgi:hypothetical protein